jgi:hypothetical protein
MGTWGKAILSDDEARDVYDAYIRAYNAGGEPSEITRELIATSAEQIEDSDDGPIFWLALAKAQWDVGALDADVASRIEGIVAGGAGLDRWAEAGPRQLAKRKGVLTEFLEQLRRPNPNPRKRKPPKFVKSVFRPGDCLAMTLADGSYGAAIVLAAGEGFDAYGTNLIGTLKFKSVEKPTQDVFERRQWLQLTHHANRGAPWITWCFRTGFRKFAPLFEVVASTPLQPSDPTTANSYCRWDLVPSQVVLQFKWDAGDRT